MVNIRGYSHLRSLFILQKIQEGLGHSVPIRKSSHLQDVNNERFHCTSSQWKCPRQLSYWDRLAEHIQEQVISGQAT